MKDNSIQVKKYFLYALIIKLLLVIVFSFANNLEHPNKAIFSYFGSIHNDYSYFISPVENFIKKGLYSYDSSTPFAGRMPGYAIIYYFFRLFTNQEVSNILLIVFQLVISAFGSLAFALSAQNIFKKKNSFKIAFWLSLIYPVSTFFDYQTITEGLAINFIIFTVYFLTNIEKTKSNFISLTLSGLFFIWAVFLRPYLSILGPVFVIYLIDFPQLKQNILYAIKQPLLWSIPVILMMGIWNFRNYKQFGKIILLETEVYDSYGKLYSYSWFHMRKMMSSWGGETGYFIKDSDAYWFRKDKTDAKPPMNNKVFEKECFSKNDIISLKNEYQDFYYANGFDRQLDTTIAEKAISYKECYKRERTVKEALVIYGNTIRKLTINSGSAYMPKFKNKYIYSSLKLYFLLIYYSLLLLAFYAFIVSINSKILFIPIFTLIFALILYTPMLEHRYFLGVFPFLMFMSVEGLLNVFSKLKTIHKE